MNILSIESASTVCGTALFINNELIDIIELNKARIHSEELPVMVKKILNNNNLNVPELNGIAVSEGPGSYTGLRIGISLAKGLAVANNIPIIPVPTLQAINQDINEKGIYWVIIHSHKDMVYTQKFNSGTPVSKIKYSKFDINKFSKIYGFNLDKLCSNKEYFSILPSSKLIGKLAIERFSDWAKNDHSLITPNYITDFNFNKVPSN